MTKQKLDQQWADLPSEIAVEAARLFFAQINTEIADKAAASIAGAQNKRWFSPEEAAHYLGLTEKGLEYRRSQGTGPRVRRVSTRTIRYDRADLDAWMLGGSAE